ncbi:helix-turn-helix domain-containing protein [Streptococcus caprae]|uniref:Helix-turn-helix domain-containing protein n=1 Tax=Streptococcus caprae TaxID=1640501 RepID=A0ABV8CTM3_9STRE
MTSLHPFGPTFKTLREQRGYSLKEAAGSIVSPQFLSQFEKEQKGMSLENFSRLLISIGIDWLTFASEYDGESIDLYSKLFSQAVSKYPLSEAKTIKELETSIDPFLKDNSELKNLSKILTKFLLLKNDKHALEKDIEQAITYLNKQTYFNTLELDTFCALIDTIKNCPLSLIQKVRDFLLDSLKPGMTTSEHHNTLIILAHITNYLSRNGYFNEAKKILDKTGHYPSPNAVATGTVMIAMQEAYYLIRQNDRAALEKARNILDYIEASNKIIPSEALIKIGRIFEHNFNELNHTGIGIYD